MSVLWTPLRLVVEDEERAAKANDELVPKNPPHLNGDAIRQFNASRNTFITGRTTLTLPYTQHETIRIGNRSTEVDVSDGVPVTKAPVKAKLKSFEESPRLDHCHNPKFLESELNGAAFGFPNQVVEREDGSEERHRDEIKPLREELKGRPLNVDLPGKLQSGDLQASFKDPEVDKQANKANGYSGCPEKEKLANTQKDNIPEPDCFVDCLYYTCQCCECSIM